jgi:hypothetical protein
MRLGENRFNEAEVVADTDRDLHVTGSMSEPLSARLDGAMTDHNPEHYHITGGA